MSKDIAPLTTPLPSPSIGDTNPSSSLSALWSYLCPALDHTLQLTRTSNDAESTQPPPITIEYRMGIYTHCYNYFMARSEAANSSNKSLSTHVNGTDLYNKLDEYYTNTAHELFLGAPDDTTLIHYLLSRFNHYNTGAISINRLLNCLNQHYVQYAIKEGKGWFHGDNTIGGDATGIRAAYSWASVSQRQEDRRVHQLKKWGYKDGSSAQRLAQAEACAEAASRLDCVVPLSSLALRRFRTEVIEPLLQVPGIEGMGKLDPPAIDKTKAVAPEGQLIRAMKTLETKDGDEAEKRRLGAELRIMLRIVGVRPNKLPQKKKSRQVYGY